MIRIDLLRKRFQGIEDIDVTVEANDIDDLTILLDDDNEQVQSNALVFLSRLRADVAKNRIKAVLSGDNDNLKPSALKVISYFDGNFQSSCLDIVADKNEVTAIKNIAKKIALELGHSIQAKALSY
ncbi:hypothetical protein [Pseudoalteromonas lipolytica]|uniref:hypothetical protein n=1 Tax=Pseudoalteromonas lipolytica TaxID=570156 RepID=UPI00241D0F69|nr:hypothetical protein [Pseudoalteromonas lipolytica]|tara:strand:+ start:3752 stop:4129 length:378 start_codon:yes stop_codon:yes gene_type:complete